MRGCELLRDPRVIRAILHFGALALAKARGAAIGELRKLTQDSDSFLHMTYWDRHALKRLRAGLDGLEPYARRIERVYERLAVH